ncbi:hypothetical protein KIN20_024440 [Parelaphostrongylus tenuis]|uniref:Uncharacterized protein n=1 Tax=Parelaphostrongylus tenuis TaxID=148309 RepID=A0AAD5N865_PARTN|nr:hypothetical protein KIN20_024440 [Parelaphostrongylus tenuis]
MKISTHKTVEVSEKGCVFMDSGRILSGKRQRRVNKRLRISVHVDQIQGDFSSINVESEFLERQASIENEKKLFLSTLSVLKCANIYDCFGDMCHGPEANAMSDVSLQLSNRCK